MPHPTVARIHLDRLRHNYLAIKGRTAPARVIPVVKADAYGHGAVACCRELCGRGASFFAVARLDEARALAESGIRATILIFGRILPDELAVAVREGFRVTAFSRRDLDWMEKAAAGRKAFVHVKVDTGMGRVGLIPDQDPGFFSALAASPSLIFEGLYSHFSTSDEKDPAFALQQLASFQSLVSALGAKNMAPPMVHMANSGAVLSLPGSFFTHVRPGILMYGYPPSRECPDTVTARPVMTFESAVAHLRLLPEGAPVSYGRLWAAPRETRVAVVPAGYGDGYPRSLTGRARVLIRGKKYPVVGRVTMDQIMVHVGDDPVAEGDPVVLWGETDQGGIPLWDIAETLGTIPYELCCGVSPRVPRMYVDEESP
ncbi:MAG: alanine racemase [Thermodesulfobacteriota bacterium]